MKYQGTITCLQTFTFVDTHKVYEAVRNSVVSSTAISITYATLQEHNISQILRGCTTCLRFHTGIVKNGDFWYVTPCGFCKNRRFGGTEHFHHQGDKNRRTRNNVSRTFSREFLFLCSVCRLLVPANVVPSSLILSPQNVGSYKSHTV
jgi:hypothetical protein